MASELNFFWLPCCNRISHKKWWMENKSHYFWENSKKISENSTRFPAIFVNFFVTSCIFIISVFFIQTPRNPISRFLCCFLRTCCALHFFFSNVFAFFFFFEKTQIKLGLSLYFPGNFYLYTRYVEASHTQVQHKIFTFLIISCS